MNYQAWITYRKNSFDLRCPIMTGRAQQDRTVERKQNDGGAGRRRGEEGEGLAFVGFSLFFSFQLHPAPREWASVHTQGGSFFSINPLGMLS